MYPLESKFMLENSSLFRKFAQTYIDFPALPARLECFPRYESDDDNNSHYSVECSKENMDGSTCLFTCRKKVKGLTQSKSAICQRDGSWSAEPPVCQGLLTPLIIKGFTFFHFHTFFILILLILLQARSK